ncbi:UNVERIFIED_CONTAM: hypothetical protein FKN15_018463 [Acipenser sinensis]
MVLLNLSQEKWGDFNDLNAALQHSNIAASGSKPTFPCTLTNLGFAHRSLAISNDSGSCLTALGMAREDPPCAP